MWRNDILKLDTPTYSVSNGCILGDTGSEANPAGIFIDLKVVWS